MDIFQMERSGHGSKRIRKPVVSFLIAFCLLYIASMFYRSSTSVLIGEVARDHITGEVIENVTRCYETESEDERSSGTESMAVDKFLGGLLATGFDEESCISRYQAALYRKTSSHKPSAYLVSKLRKYEELHKRCGPDTESYIRTLKKLSSSHNNGTTDCNYIVWTPSNGLGNRIISMASSFLYAVLTNRVLLVDHGTDMAGIFCEPFPDTSWLLPMDFPSHRSILQLATRKCSQLRAPAKDEQHGHLNRVTGASDQYFVPYLFLLPSFQQELGKLFPDKEAVFHHLVRYLFHPSNQAWGLITRFYQAYLASADQKIGLQMSTKLIASPSKNKTSRAVTIASLYPEYYESIKSLYWMNPTVNGDVIGVYQPSHEEVQHYGNNIHNLKAWAEISILSLSDVLVTSSWSTFGYVAQGLGGLKPWILYVPAGNRPTDEPCPRGNSMEPCFHFPPDYYRIPSTKERPDAGSPVPHVRQCEDASNGIKLFNS
ncbi:2-ALPHA-L-FUCOSYLTRANSFERASE putative-RELATED [Salix koriyanagi]|uniref:Fucosyltransferase n=1 Tax=Salix koriyanagi TaxID=2511006 RepID=A0A9Q0PVI3_9ROSI|nr:2-ALPHA-L-FUCOSYLTRANSFERASE putative-RELATED [Salix koriyanagi]